MGTRRQNSPAGVNEITYIRVPWVRVKNASVKFMYYVTQYTIGKPVRFLSLLDRASS